MKIQVCHKKFYYITWILCAGNPMCVGLILFYSEKLVIRLEDDIELNSVHKRSDNEFIISRILCFDLSSLWVLVISKINLWKLQVECSSRAVELIGLLVQLCLSCILFKRSYVCNIEFETYLCKRCKYFFFILFYGLNDILMSGCYYQNHSNKKNQILYIIFFGWKPNF